ncbi:hypothetical protein IMZ48_30825 [Candidatus Bathyarchaeota archaeon]|nr:hypothetical protein [Candidatus Bathyarchaeota archaeon]
MDPRLQAMSERPLKLDLDEGDEDQESFSHDEHEQAGPSEGAPRYTVPPRAMGAVEIPMIVADVDRATRAFGNIGSFKAVSPYHFLAISRTKGF